MVIVPLSLVPADGAAPNRARRAEPVTVGLPFPRGVWREGTAVGMRGADGDYVPVQIRVRDRWSDESVRWGLVDFQADAPEGSASYELVVGGPAAPPRSDRIHVREVAGTVVVDTGAACFQLATAAPFPFAAVEVQGTAAIDANQSGLTILDQAGRTHVVRVQRVWVEDAGPLRAAVGIAARSRDSSGAAVDITARIELFAGSAAARCVVTVRNPRRAQHAGGFWELGDAGSIYLRDVAAAFTLNKSTEPAEVRCSPECGVPMSACAGPLEVYQDSSGGENWRSPNHRDRDGAVRRTIPGYRLRSSAGEHDGRRATPIMSVTRGSRVITVAMRQFWQNFPKALEATGDSIALRLFPKNAGELHELQGGEQKTHSFVVSFGADPITDLPLDWARSPLVAAAEPAWYASTGALRHLVPVADAVDERQRAFIAAAVDGHDTFARKREVIDEYGWRNFGDLYADHEAVGATTEAPLVSHYNNQYDAIAGFALQFMRTADRRWYELMADLTAHVIDIDIYHCDEDKSAYNGGLFWHTAHYIDAGLSSHRTYPRAPGVRGGGPADEHNHTSGLMLHYFLTGDLQSREAAVGLAQWVINMDDGQQTPFRWLAGGHTGLATQSGSPFYHGPGRGAANSLSALIDAHQLTGDPAFLGKADEVIRRSVHPEDDIDAHQLRDAERKWFYTMFLQALGKYLDYKIERGQVDAMYGYARATLLHYARWMADHEYPYLEKPEILEYPTETWAAQDIRKSDVFAHAAAHAGGAERERFIERAAFFFRYSIDTLLQMPTRTLTRPVVLLLTNGWACASVRRTAEPCGAALDTEGIVLPPRRAFTPQKVRAIRRAKQIGAAIAGIAGVVCIRWLL